MKIKYNSGYLMETATHYVDNNQLVYSLNTELEPKYKYESGQRTDTIDGYSAWFSQKSVEPFKVKFSEEITLPKYMTVVQFEKLQAVEVNYNVFCKADGIKNI
ncbi:hypothetical protein [uncultured Fructobacillus sp.]|jgi:hypothetical protein|uniref:hypothetical protein n=1 Tax=uncultured Fructobacillus sp. TaxID=591942 RepID=UPI0025919950|nr:hypothetical protein [uncultured Fructobacillus sp.]